MHSNRQALFLLGLGASIFAVSACGSGGSSTSNGGSSGGMDLVQVSNGFGQLLPHTILRLDSSGNPTGTAIPIRTTSDLLANHTGSNLVLPVVQYPTDARLPSGGQGNHFMYAQFTSDVDITSILDSSPANQSNGGLTGTITLVALDPEARIAEPIPCRVFLDGKTYAGTPTADDPDHLPLQQWVSVDPNTGQVVALPVDGTFPGRGFPGTPGYEFSGASGLISPHTVVFVADSDGDLTGLETFPQGREIEMRITTSVRSTGGTALARRALAATTVGPDTLRPVVATQPPPLTTPIISPGDGQTNVDPTTPIHIEFSEPVQPISIGTLPNGQPPVDPAVIISFGPAAQQVQMPYTVLPTSVFDLSAYDITPSFNFPGEGPPDLQCGVFNAVTIHVAAPDKFKDLASPANTNLIGADTNFTCGEGPGVINAPVAPDTIYVGRSGAVPGLSVIDLNGFGQGSGDPTFNALHPVEGNTNFPNNPNLRLQGAQVRPPLEPGLCTINGGSAGVFTLARDSSMNDLLLRAPLITSIGDTMIGHGLDSTFNNGPSPFGCQSGGGNLCASDAKKIINPTVNGNSMIPTGNGQVNGTISAGAENLVCWGPHPNPPALFFPPLCVSPFIGGQEPTSIDTTLTAATGLPGGPGLTNLLGPGDPFGNPLASPPIPPTGLLAPEQNQYFEGPSLPNAIQLCQPYMMRQQIGHFLYVIDRGRREIVVLNSNRMTVIDRIPTQDPTTLAMSPNLNLLAVVNQTANLVSFIDIDPHSSTFHQVVQETSVGERPRGVAWEPGNEDILVCNENENTLSIISAATLQVRKLVRSQLSGPFDIAITPRQLGFGYQRYVYFGYVLNRNGRVAVFESGPNTVNGWGYDDIIGIVQPIFQNPKAIQPDHVDLRSAVWIAHEGPIDANGNGGAVGVPALSKLVIDSALSGVLVLNANTSTPQFRDMHLGVQVSIGPPQLSGIPVDIAFDDMRNWAGLPNYQTPFSVGAALPINGKQLVRVTALVGYHAANTPRYMFAAVPNPFVGTGVVDVIRIDQSYVRVDTNPFVTGIQSIPVDNCQIVADYFRQ